MSAVLRASGTVFDVDAFLPDCALLVCAVHRRGEPHGQRGPSEVSAVTIDVSTAEFGDLAGQVADALHFLDTYAN